ncbi:DNA repair protein RecN [Synechocystis sp. LKSZ1]|uniref:DNA repair protein RecN n=1 Tax=Synechocystis sp. LKSZ1 TaxID=3144951 RepID=UPI00336BE1A5
MLSSLHIENFALIDRLDITFQAGLNVLTGETGAGKSIILDAIDLVLGGKATGQVIRQGCQRAFLEASFDVSESLYHWLQERAIEPLEDQDLVCSRELSWVGDSLRSRSRVNGAIVNRQLLGELRAKLVEITAQGQTVQLMDSTVQRQLLDLYGGSPLFQQRQQVEAAYRAFAQAEQALAERRQSEQNRLQRLDLLAYQRQELQGAALVDSDEAEHLAQEQERLSHVVELQQLSYQAYQLLYQNDRGETAVADLLAQAESILQEMGRYDPQLDAILTMVQEALTQVVEAGQQLNTYGDRLEADPQRLGEVEERVQLLKRLCRKYGPSLVEVISYRDQIEQEWLDLTSDPQSLEALEQAYDQAQQALGRACQQLTALRRKTAQQLETQLVKELKPLAMEKVMFACHFSAITPTAHGADLVVFYFSPNPGEKMQPLAATASGGEMSRFLLALKACFSATVPQQTLVFDEIDVGVSGKVAQAIADKLHQLSQSQQVLCVTHQPLVAALADVHFRVDKTLLEAAPSESAIDLASELRTVVRITALDSPQGRQEELAQLAGGHSAQEALSFAASLLKKATARRKMSSLSP